MILNPSACGCSQTRLVERVRFIPDISAMALKCHKVDEVSLWYCLRALNLSGSGAVDKDVSLRALTGIFGYTRKTVYRHLAKGEGIFWTQKPLNGKRHICIHGIFRVGRLLGIRWTQRNFREVEAHRFANTLTRRAEVYASIHKPMSVRANPMSRACIEAMTGLSKAQQRRYEKASGIRRVVNSTVISSGDGRRDTVVPEKMRVECKDHVHWVNKRLPNTYRTHQSQSNKGQLKGLPDFSNAAGSSVSGEALEPLSRTYFKSYKDLVERLSRRGECESHQGYYLLNSKHRLKRGRLEWCSCSGNL